MAWLDDESDVLSLLKNVQNDRIVLLTPFKDEDGLLWEKIKMSPYWEDNSKDTRNPPDFYNDVEKIMIEVMQVNDYEYVEKVDKKEVVVNPIKAYENKNEKKARKEFEEKQGFSLRKDDSIFIKTDSVKTDASIEKLFDNFNRVFNKHLSKVDSYRKNHDGYSLCFVICDISEKWRRLKLEDGSTFPYHPCLEKRFLNLMQKTNIEYLLWFTPYLKPEKDFPELVIINIKNMPSDMGRVFNWKEGKVE